MIPLRDVNPTRRRPVATIGIIAICLAAFLVELFVQWTDGDRALDQLIRDWGLVPSFVSGQLGGGDQLPRALATLVSSMFLHGGPLHVGFNLLFLWIFGNNIEDRLGHLGFLVFYLAGGLAAAAAQIAVDPSSTTPVIGASGAIAAVLGAYLVLYPGARVLSLVYFGLFFQLIQVPAVILLGVWIAVQVVSAIVASGGDASDGGVALFAHIGGFVAGVLFGLVVRLMARPGRPRPLHPTDRIGVG